MNADNYAWWMLITGFADRFYKVLANLLADGTNAGVLGCDATMVQKRKRWITSNGHRTRPSVSDGEAMSASSTPIRFPYGPNAVFNCTAQPASKS